jgi:hypothetical protein
LSLPAIVTAVAFVAVTVSFDEPPGATDVGLALIETVASVSVTVVDAVAVLLAPTAVAV